MQIMPRTAVFVADMLGESVDTKALVQSDTNIKLGTKYLDYLQDKFQDETVVLACYNAGEGVVRSWLKDTKYSIDGKTLKFIPYKETREYVQNVQRGKEIYKSKL
jgi:soluble lytic murein transglycosylase